MDFNKEAMEWDDKKRADRAAIIAAEIDTWIEPDKNLNAMEFGCGTGLISFHLRERLKKISLVDTSSGMIQVLKEKIKAVGATNMEAYLGDLQTEEIVTGEFDIIYTSMALHHISDVDSILKKLSGYLKKGGKLCIVDLVEEDGSFHKNEKDFDGHNGFNLESLKKILRKSGLNRVEYKVFYNDRKKIEDTEVEYSLFLMVGTKVE